MVFFFQAEDGIRDSSVTGVQTCALPISRRVCRGAALRGYLDGRQPGDLESHFHEHADAHEHGAFRLWARRRRHRRFLDPKDGAEGKGGGSGGGRSIKKKKKKDNASRTCV